MNNTFSIIAVATRIAGCFFLVFFLSQFQAIQAQAVTNPVFGPNWPDPTIWQAEGGRYYCMATNPRTSIVSDDLVRWRRSEVAPISADSWEKMRAVSQHYWAPDVAMVNGRRLMYISLYNSAEDSNIGVLRQTESGQFEYVGIITSGKKTGIMDTIDPEVVTDPATGKVWLFFGSVGRIHRVEMEKDGLSLKKGAKYEPVAGLHVNDCPSRSQVFEGCYLHYRQGWWYMFVSSGFFGDHTYKLQVGRARRLTDPFLNRDGKPMTEGFATPVIWSDKGDNFYGPGHCGEIFRASDGAEYIFYHCHVRDSRRPEQRAMFVSLIQWDAEGWPFVQGGKPVNEIDLSL